jgi:hypothetical protein
LLPPSPSVTSPAIRLEYSAILLNRYIRVDITNTDASRKASGVCRNSSVLLKAPFLRLQSDVSPSSAEKARKEKRDGVEFR